MGQAIKIIVFIVIVLVIWKIAGGTVDGVVDWVGNVLQGLADFLQAIATKIAEMFTGGGGGSSAASAAK